MKKPNKKLVLLIKEKNSIKSIKIDMEQTKVIADIILRSLESVQKIGQIVGTAMVK